MAWPRLSPGGAVWWGGLAAGLLELSAVLAFWIARDVPPSAILRSIASALLGPAAAEGGTGTVLLGLSLHFAVSFAFAAAYVGLSLRVPVLKIRPVSCGIAYGLAAYFVMSFIVVPLSRATFGANWPPPWLNFAASLFIHLFLFGLPIALAASRIAAPAGGQSSILAKR